MAKSGVWGCRIGFLEEVACDLKQVDRRRWGWGMRDAVGPGDERVWYTQEIENGPISF